MSNFSTTSTSATERTPDPWPYSPLEEKQGYFVLTIFFVGTLMNLFGLFISLRIKMRKSVRSNDLIIVLGIVDLALVFLAGGVTCLVYLEKGWVGGSAMCEFQGFVSNMGALSSGGFTVLLAVDRMLAVKKPVFYHSIVRRSHHWYAVVAVILVSTAMGILPVFAAGRYMRAASGTFCAIDWSTAKAADITVVCIICLIGIALALISLYCNISVLMALKKIVHKRRSLFGNPVAVTPQDDTIGRSTYAKKDVINGERSHALTVLLLSIVFLACWFPYVVRILLYLADWQRQGMFDITVGRLILINSVVNPFVYTFLRKSARQEVKSCCTKYNSAVAEVKPCATLPSLRDFKTPDVQLNDSGSLSPVHVTP